MAKTRRGRKPGDDSQEEGGPEIIEVSDTTAGGSTAPEDNPNEDYVDRMGDSNLQGPNGNNRRETNPGAGHVTPHPRSAVITTKLHREYSGASRFTKFCASERDWRTTSDSDSSRVCDSLPV